MEELCWINGTILPLSEAKVSVEDRGFVFADGVYEVVRVNGGNPFAMGLHMDRFKQSCEGIGLVFPASIDFSQIAVDLINKRRLSDGIIYMQVTRGAGRREHTFPVNGLPTVMIYTREMVFKHLARQRMISVADDRWNRCWIKSIALLPNVLAKQKAVEAGADEAIFVSDGQVREGCTTNVFIVRGDELLTSPVGEKVLAGITRSIVLSHAKAMGMGVIERFFSLDEAYESDEAFITSTTREIAWIAEWDGRPIGDGTCGRWTNKLADGFRATGV